MSGAKFFSIVVATPVNDGNFVSSNVAEDEAPFYDSGTTYNSGDLVIFDHVIYESLQDNNLGNTPGLSPTFWVFVSPTNQRAAFDEKSGTFSQRADFIEFQLSGDRIDAFSFFEVDAQRIEIVGQTGDFGVFYNKTFVVGEDFLVSNWYQYFFGRRLKRTELVVSEIPAYANATFTVRIYANGPQDIAKVGTVIFGQKFTLGKTALGASLGLIDFSVKQDDGFGNLTLVPRAFRKRQSVQIFVKNSNLDATYRLLQQIRARLVVFIGADELYRSLNTYGFYRDFGIDMQLKQESVLTLEIEGLI